MYHFDHSDFSQLAELFNPAHAYAGYKPEGREAPNGDGHVDADKRYLHIATKYNPPAFATAVFARAFTAACEVAEALHLPHELRPSVHQCALRVLEYSAGAGSAVHTDFNMFTLNLWRSEPVFGMEARSVAGYSVHLGELAGIFEVGKAEAHLVPGLPRRQQSLVFFSLPDLSVSLPAREGADNGPTVGDWLRHRIARSRITGYK